MVKFGRIFLAVYGKLGRWINVVLQHGDLSRCGKLKSKIDTVVMKWNFARREGIFLHGLGS